MGPIIPALVSQVKPLLPETNPNIRQNDSPEKRRRASPKKRFGPATPKKPTNGTDDAMAVREDTPWPRAGKMSGNLFEERNWVLPKDCLAIDSKKEDVIVAKPSPKEEPKMGEQTSSQMEEKCGWGPNCPFCKAQKKEVDPPNLQEQIEDQQQKPLPKLQAKRPEMLNITRARQQCKVQP